MAKIEEISDDKIENIDGIIQKSNIKDKLDSHPDDDLEIGEVFAAILYIIPFRSLPISSHGPPRLSSVQPVAIIQGRGDSDGKSNSFSTSDLSNHLLLYANKSWMQIIYLLSSIALGISLIKLINDAPSYQIIKRAPSIGMLWVYTVVQAKLSYAVISCIIIAVWVKQSDEKIMY
ncbi:hypothetical protein E3Q18_01171 [Wallemia mellicola]|nr:hypothetical protein E3Q18_01171 [Wallemia mellicola]